MKTMTGILIVGSVLMWAQNSAPPMQKGVSVQMAVAEHAVEMKAADQQGATVVAITADGKVYRGVDAVEPAALGSVTAGTVYLKADSRAPYQKVLAVLDALRGKEVVLLTSAPAGSAPAGRTLSPYGVKLTMGR